MGQWKLTSKLFHVQYGPKYYIFGSFWHGIGINNRVLNRPKKVSTGLTWSPWGAIFYTLQKVISASLKKFNWIQWKRLIKWRKTDFLSNFGHTQGQKGHQNMAPEAHIIHTSKCSSSQLKKYFSVFYYYFHLSNINLSDFVIPFSIFAIFALLSLIVRRAGLLWSQQDFEWWWSVPLSSASLY